MNNYPSASPASLHPLKLIPLAPGVVRPRGWLLDQLKTQAAGLGGHLDEFWPSVARSAWIGGDDEGWERGPYWLDGIIPLAFALADQGLIAKARKWIDYILDHQHPDGWLGPLVANPDPQSHESPYAVWPRFVVLKALTQWQEATGDPRVIPAMLRFAGKLPEVLRDQPLNEWARSRWPELVLSLHWLFDRTGDVPLLDLCQLVKEQGLDWARLFSDFPHRTKVTQAQLEAHQRANGGLWMNDLFLSTHGVNVAMAWKTGGVWWRQSGETNDAQLIQQMIETLDRYHGQAHGLYSCDEHLAGLHPSQGTELCTVVEAMFSLEVCLAAQGDAVLGDRLEKLAFNALPATFKPDMWAHQYDQQANQVVCKISESRIYTNNGADANLYGLEPHFGCCCANFHQGWPKFVTHMWMRTAEGGLAAVAYGPCSLSVAVGGTTAHVDVLTDYPFDGTIHISVRVEQPARFELLLRIPQWANDPTVTLDDQDQTGAVPGSFFRLERDWEGQCQIRLTLPMRVLSQRRYNGAVTLTRGPLVLAMNIRADWRKMRGDLLHADWEVCPTSDWNYGLLSTPGEIEEQIKLTPPVPGVSPFSPHTAPLRALVKARQVVGWNLKLNCADAPPVDPHPQGPIREVELLPYGCTNLRLAEMPRL